MFEFFYGNEVEQYLFYSVPKALFDNKFKSISCVSKLLYGLLIDRCGISRKNNWFDNSGRLYVYFKQEEAMEKLGIGKDKAIKIFMELEKIGLIIRKKQGQGNPTKIYVMNFAKPVNTEKNVTQCENQCEKSKSKKSRTSAQKSKEEVQTSENPKSEKNETEVLRSENPKSKTLKSRGLEVVKTDSNNTEISNNERINPSIYQDYREAEIKSMSKSEPKIQDDGQTDLTESITENIKFQIEYDTCLERLDELGITVDTLDLIVDILLEPYISDLKITINGIPLSSYAIRTQFEKISFEHIQYVFDSMRATAQNKKIKNLRSYLRTCLYNAPHTIDQHYANEVDYSFNN